MIIPWRYFAIYLAVVNGETYRAAGEAIGVSAQQAHIKFNYILRFLERGKYKKNGREFRLCARRLSESIDYLLGTDKETLLVEYILDNEPSIEDILEQEECK